MIESMYNIPIDENVYIKPGEKRRFVFSGEKAGKKSQNSNWLLRLIGEVDIFPSLRCEPGFPLLYRMIDDSLDGEETYKSRYSLKLDSRGESFNRRAYYKIVWPPQGLPKHRWKDADISKWQFGIWCKKQEINVLDGGCIKLILEIFYKKEGAHPEDISRECDEKHEININDGTRNWHELQSEISLLKDVASILVYVTGEKFKGTVWFERPHLSIPGEDSIIPPFELTNSYWSHLNWLGENLSKKEWPSFKISLNGEEVYKGEKFQRIYRWPAAEIKVQDEKVKTGENVLEIELTSQYNNPLPYVLKKIELARTENDVLNVVSYPKVALEGRQFAVMVSSNRENIGVNITVDRPEAVIPLEKKVVLKEGLNYIKFSALKAGQGTEIKLKTKEREEVITLQRVVHKQEDDVLTGTGDAVYIPQDLDEMEHFLKWYLHHQIGNSITFRPVYRWSGTRQLNPKVWEKVKEICEGNYLNYSHMVDGRELPGCNANPHKNHLLGKYYMGSQAHEQDGAYYYWGPREISKEEEIFYDIWGREVKTTGIFPKVSPIRTAQGVFMYQHIYIARDMEDAASRFVNNNKCTAQEHPRHTGPSVLFKYFYEAGFQWLGAELMYGPQEVVLAALRGASKAYGKEKYGAHLAVQWSTTPHDDIYRYRRYFLALAVCYIQGVEHINTEEGLWRLEERYADYERNSEVCIEHRKIQQDFYRYVQTHTRRGKVNNPIAFLHGKYDGWVCFGRNQVWAREGDEWKFNYPEESWDLLKVFYPRSHLDSIYRHPCPKEPQGFYTGTPYGNVDIVPIEAGSEVLTGYSNIIFLGWNTADEGQIGKIKDYVAKGGELILGWPHLYTEKDRVKSITHEGEVLWTGEIQKLLGIKFMGFVYSNQLSAEVGNVDLVTAIESKKDYQGNPIVLTNVYGLGKVTFVNVRAYPAEKPVRVLYENLLKGVGKKALDFQKSKGWIAGSENVEFTVWDSKDRREIYLLNVNWWDELDRPEIAHLMWGEKEIPVQVMPDVINKITIKDDIAVMISDNETDILDLYREKKEIVMTVQGCGKTKLYTWDLCTGKHKCLTEKIEGIKTCVCVI